MRKSEVFFVRTLETDVIDKKLKFLQAFWSKMATRLETSSQTPGSSCATPGAFIKVRIGHLELVEAGDIDQNLEKIVLGTTWTPFFY